MQVQTLLSEPAVEALDVGVLRRFAGIDEIQFDAIVGGPGIERAAGKFGAVVDDKAIWVTTLTCRPVEQIDQLSN